MIGYLVFCEICGHGYDERDPGIRYLNIDRAWTCIDEAACFDRRALHAADAPTRDAARKAHRGVWNIPPGKLAGGA